MLVLVNDLAAGGAQRAALDQAASLDPQRFEVELASLEIQPAGAWAEERFRHLPIRRLRGAGDAHPRAWLALARRLDRFRPDLVHSHLVASGVLGTVVARFKRVPRVVTTFHNLSDWEEKRAQPLRVAVRRASAWCDAVVVVTEAVRAAMARVSPGLARRALVIPNGVDLGPFLEAGQGRAAARARLGYQADHFVVGSVARLDPRKGLDVLIEAVAMARPRLPELRVLLVGDGLERARLEARARARGLQDVVCFAGEQADVRSHLAAMDLFAAPSRSEGQGVAIIEAMAAGLPVLGSRVGGIPEVVLEGRCGWLLAPDALRLWADALERIVRHPEECRRRALEARRRAREFSLEATRERLERLYEELLAPQQVRNEAA